MRSVVGVNFADSKKIYYFLINKLSLKKSDFVIVETERGLQYGEVVTDIISVDEKKLNNPLKKVVKIATEDDAKINKENEKDAACALEDAIKISEELNLDMKLFDASFTFDRKQLMISFLADERVDFRDLAKRLAGIYKTRIELRQIGVRDKAKCVGGYGQCGQKLCCSSFLRDINSVSINMAKNQNLALNPQKINGVCGRLMCCLSFENDCYGEYKKGLPKVGEKVVYEGQEGKVIFVDIFAKKYKIENSEGNVIDVTL